MTDVSTFLTTWAAAERDGDAATTDRLLTADFVGIGPVGFQLPKSAWLQRQTGGDLHYDSLSLDEVTTREFGDCAVTTARWNARGTARAIRSPKRRAPRSSPSRSTASGAWRRSTSASSPTTSRDHQGAS